MSSFQQLPLPLRFDQSCRFEHFYSEDDYVSHVIKAHLDVINESLLLVKGENSTGKSHLLNAAALYCQQKHIAFQFYDAQLLMDYGVDALQPCEKDSVLIIDDLQCFAGNMDWERKLYDLYNDAQRYGWVLLVSILNDDLSIFKLKDLISRLHAGFSIRLNKHSEHDLKEIIKLRSKLLGLKLKSEVIDYLLVHFSRELSLQMKMLSQLDQQALEKNRNITIPFIKEIFNV